MGKLSQEELDVLAASRKRLDEELSYYDNVINASSGNEMIDASVNQEEQLRSNAYATSGGAIESSTEQIVPEEEQQSDTKDWWNSLMNHIDEIQKGYEEDDVIGIQNEIDLIQRELDENDNIGVEQYEQLESKLQELKLNQAVENRDVAEEEADIEGNKVDASYQAEQQYALEDEHTNPWDYLKYELPADLGGSASEWGAQAFLATKDVVSKKLKNYIIKNAAKSVAAEVLPGAGTGVHLALTAGLTAIDIGADLFTLYKMREHETGSESSEAYKQRLNSLMEQHGINPAMYDQLDPKTQRDLRIEAYKGIDEFKRQQMGLATQDFVERILIGTNWMNRIPGVKGLGKLNPTDYNRFTRATGKLGRAYMGASMEGGEEAAQYSFAQDYVAGRFLTNPEEMTSYWDSIVHSQKELAKGTAYAAGISGHKYEGDKDFRNAVRSGMLLGGMMTGIPALKGAGSDLIDYNRISKDTEATIEQITNPKVVKDNEGVYKNLKFAQYLSQGKSGMFLEKLRQMEETPSKNWTTSEIQETREDFLKTKKEYNALHSKVANKYGKEAADNAVGNILPGHMTLQNRAKEHRETINVEELNIGEILANNGVSELDSNVHAIKKEALKNVYKSLDAQLGNEKNTEQYNSFKKKLDKIDKQLKAEEKDVVKSEKPVVETLDLMESYTQKYASQIQMEFNLDIDKELISVDNMVKTTVEAEEKRKEVNKERLKTKFEKAKTKVKEKAKKAADIITGVKEDTIDESEEDSNEIINDTKKAIKDEVDKEILPEVKKPEDILNRIDKASELTKSVELGELSQELKTQGIITDDIQNVDELAEILNNSADANAIALNYYKQKEAIKEEEKKNKPKVKEDRVEESNKDKEKNRRKKDDTQKESQTDSTENIDVKPAEETDRDVVAIPAVKQTVTNDNELVPTEDYKGEQGKYIMPTKVNSNILVSTDWKNVFNNGGNIIKKDPTPIIRNNKNEYLKKRLFTTYKLGKETKKFFIKVEQIGDEYHYTVTPTDYVRGHIIKDKIAESINNTVDTNYINKGNLKIGDKIYIEYTVSDYNNATKFNQGKLPLEYVKYDGDKRVVVGINAVNNNSDLQALVKSEAGTHKSVRKNEKLTTEVTSINSGVISNSAVYNSASDVFDNLVVGVTKNDGSVVHLVVDEESLNNMNVILRGLNSTAKEGFAYAIVPEYDGVHAKPIKLWQKKLDQVPELVEKVKDIFTAIQNKGQSFKTIDELKDIADPELFNILPILNSAKSDFQRNVTLSYNAESNEFTFKVADSNTFISSDVNNLINGIAPKAMLQVDMDKLHLPAYLESIKERLSTDSIPGKPFVNTKISFSKNLGEVNTGVETKPISTEDLNITDADDIDVAPFAMEEYRTDTETKSWSIEKQTEWFHDVFGKEAPIEILDSLKNVAEHGEDAFGVFVDNVVYIAKNAPSGTIFHEAFHKIFRTYLTPRQRKALYKEASKRYKHKLDLDVISKMMDDYNIDENEAYTLWLEEEMAEEFRPYIANEEFIPNSISERIRNFFKELRLLIKQYLGKDMNIDEVFFMGAKGKIRKSNIVRNKSNAAKGAAYRRIEAYSNDELNTVANSVSSLLVNHYIPKLYPNTPLNELFDEGADVKGIVDNIFKEFIGNNELNLSLGLIKGDVANNVRKFLDNIGSYELGERNKSKLNVTNFKPGKTYDIVLGKLANTHGISIATKAKIDILSEGTINDTNYSNEAYLETTGETSLRDKQTLRMKSLFSSIPMIDNLSGKPVRKYGFVVYEDGKKLFDYFLNVLKDTYSKESFNEKLASMSLYNNSAKVIYDVLFGDAKGYTFREGKNNITIPINITNKESVLSDMYNSLGKVSDRNPQNIINTKDGKTAILEATQQNVRNIIKETWNLNMSMSPVSMNVHKNTLPYVEELHKELLKHKQSGATARQITPLLKDISEIFNMYGIPLELNYMPSAYDSGNLFSMLAGKSSLKSMINNVVNNGVDFFSEENKTYINNIITSITKAKPEFSLAAYTVGGKKMYSVTLPNFTTKLIGKLKDKNTRQAMLDFYNSDNYFKASPLLKELTEDSRNIDKLKYTTLSEYKGKEYTELSPSEFDGMTLNYFLNGNEQTSYYATLTPADAPQLPLIRYKKHTIPETLDKMYEVYEQEVVRITTVKEELDNMTDEEQKGKIKNHHSSKGTSFHWFPFLNKSDFKTVLNEQYGVEDVLAIDKDTFKEVVDQYLNKEYEKYTDLLVSNGTFSKSEIDNKLKDTEGVFGNNKQKNKIDIDALVKRFVYNEMYMKTQISTLSMVDPSFYKDNDDLFKRAKQSYSPGDYLDTTLMKGNHQTYDTIYMQDTAKPSDFLKGYYNTLIKSGVSKEDTIRILSAYGYESENIVKDKNKKYNVIGEEKVLIQDVEVTDAQSFISLDRFENILRGSSQWDSVWEDTLDRIRNNKPTAADLRRVLQPIKPFVFTHSRYEYMVNGEKREKIIPIQNKNSETVLLPQFAEGNEVLEDMVAAFKKGVSSIQFESAVKAGLNNVATPQDLKDGTYKAQTLSNDDYRIQQKTPEHHLDAMSLFSTQLRKIILGDLKGEGHEYIIDGKPMSSEDIVAEFQSLLNENIKESYENVKEIFKNEKNLKEKLLQEVRDRGMGYEYELALEELPLYDPLHVQRIEAIMASMFTNEIIKQKFNGGSFINTTSYGLSKKLKVVLNEKTGAIEHFEAMLPAWSKDIRELIDENGMLDASKADPKLLDALVYRIPNEDKYSDFKIKVVGFLPNYEGGKILLPEDVTRIAGLDFDVDKVFGMMYNHIKDKETGYLSIPSIYDEVEKKSYLLRTNPEAKSINKIYNNEITKVWETQQRSWANFEGRINNLISKASLTDNEADQVYEQRANKLNEIQYLKSEISDLVRGVEETDASTEKMLKAMFPNYTSQESLIEEYDKSIAELNSEVNILTEALTKTTRKFERATEFNTKMAALKKEKNDKINNLMSDEEYASIPQIQKATKEARDNRVLDIMQGILSNPATTEAILNSGSFEKLRSIIKDRVGNKSKTGVVNSPVTTSEIYQRIMAGRDLTGIFANHNANHNVLQHYEIKANIPLVVSYNGVTHNLDNLSGKYTLDGTRISKELASILAAVLDNAKDPLAGMIGLNTSTANMFAYILRVGGTLEQAVDFLLAKPTQEFNRRLEKGESESEIFDGLGTYTKFVSLDKIDNTALKTISELANGLGDIVKGIKVEDGMGKSLSAAEVSNRNWEKLYESDFSGVTEMLDAEKAKISFIPTMKKYGIDEAVKNLSKYIPHLSETYKDYKAIIKSLAIRDLNERELDSLNSAITDYLHSSLPNLVMSNVEKEELIKDMPKRLYAMKKENNPAYSDFLNMIIVEDLDAPNKNIDKLIVAGDKLGRSNDQIDDIRAQWEEMYTRGSEQERKFAEDLVKYTYHTTGFKFKPKSIASLIPVMLKTNFALTKDVEFSMSGVFIDQQLAFTDQYVRNNFKEMYYLPTANEDTLPSLISKLSKAQQGVLNNYIVLKKDGEKELHFIKGLDENYKQKHLTPYGTKFLQEYNMEFPGFPTMYNKEAEGVIQEELKYFGRPTYREDVNEFWNDTFTNKSGNLVTFGEVIQKEGFAVDSKELFKTLVENDKTIADVEGWARKCK